jgi:hypothetical protein
MPKECLTHRDSPALRIPTIQTSLTPVHHHQRLRIALMAKRRPRRKPRPLTRLDRRHNRRLHLLAGRLKRRPLLRNQLPRRLIHLRITDQPDVLHVLLHHRADLGHDGRHVHPT